MGLKSQLIVAATTYSEVTGLSLARISTVVMNNGKFFKLLLENNSKDCTTGTYEKFMAYFAAHWPEGTPMPDAVAAAKAALERRQSAATGDAA